MEKEKAVVAWGWGYKLGLTIKGNEESYQWNENILKLIFGDGCTT